MNKALVIGIGNTLRGDDAVGHLVSEEVKGACPTGTIVLQKTGNGLDLLETWKGADLVIVVDAIRSGNTAGKIHFLDVNKGGPEWDLFGYSTHSVSLGEAIELGKALGTLPPKLFVCGIEGRSFELGMSVSAQVKEAIPRAVKLIVETLERRGHARSIPDEELNGTD